MSFLLWFILILLGICIIKYRYFIYDLTGSWGWAEAFLGGSGTSVCIVLIGMGFVFVGVSYPFGVWENVGIGGISSQIDIRR